MTSGEEPDRVPAACAAVLGEINARLGRGYRWRRQLAGGEQTGAHLLAAGDHQVVLKWEPAGWRAEQVLRAFPAVAHATERGWPAARWLDVGSLADGGAFVLRDHVTGNAVTVIDTDTAEAVVEANGFQAGCGLASAVDDSVQLNEVLTGNHPWRHTVSACSPAGAALVRHGAGVVAWAGGVELPRSDVVHGDYSSSNMVIGSTDRAVTFIDCQTIGRGTRVRDLADLYRQTFVYPDPANTGASQLRAAAIDAAGPEVFAKCVVAVTYNNLAWWAANKPVAEFDRACQSLHQLFDDARAGS